MPVLGFDTVDLKTSIILFTFFLVPNCSVNEENFLSNTFASVNCAIPVTVITPLESTNDKFAEVSGDIWLPRILV